MEELLKQLETKIDGMKASQVSQETIDTLKSEIESIKNNGITKEAIDALKEQIGNIVEEIKVVKDNMNNKVTPENELQKQIETEKETLKAIATGSSKEIVLKADTVRASIDGNTSAYRLPDIGQLGVVNPTLYDVLPKTDLGTSTNDNGVIKYIDWDEDTIVRAAAAIAEGAPFPEDTAKFKEYSLPIRKIGSVLPVSEEFFEDSALAAAELQAFMETGLRVELGDQTVNGNNIGQNLKGLLTSVPAYTAVASGISFPNIKDLVRKMRTAIIKPRGSKYRPDIVVANSDVIDTYILAKDQDGSYLFADDDGRIAGLTVVEDNNMPDNQLVVGDRRFARMYEKGGVTISSGYRDAQFQEDMMLLKIRKRTAMLIREVDKTGFLKCTDIQAALAILDDAPSV